MSAPSLINTLVIGYGNPLRQDDGVGPAAAALVAGWNRPNVSGIAIAHLAPELADQIAQADRVIFIDASLESAGGVPRLQPIGPRERITPALGHVCDPRTLLALAQALHDAAPDAWLLTVPAFAFGLGEGLSAQTRAALDQALALIADLLDNADQLNTAASLELMACTSSA